MQFGAGSELAAQCQQAPVPDGWRQWSDVDGPVPAPLAQRATQMAGDPTVSLGATESFPLPGVIAMIRVEPHVWSRDASGALVEGCFRAGAIFLPSGGASASGATSPTGGMTTSAKVITVLTIASLAVGTAATLHSWGSK